MQNHYHLLIQTPGVNISRSMRHLSGDTLSTICKEFGLKKDSPAGSIFDRVKKQILKDKQFRNKVARIKKIINKS
jgi:REP element-mobilizing transposase RayT